MLLHDGMFYLLGTQADLHVSPDPGAGNWMRVAFAWPDDAFWAGPEALWDGTGSLLAAFTWTMNGNYARFWKLEYGECSPGSEQGENADG